MTQNIEAPATSFEVRAGSLALLEMPDPEGVYRRILWEMGHAGQRSGVVHDGALLGLLLRRIPEQAGVQFHIEGLPEGSPRAQLVRDGSCYLVEVGPDWHCGLGAVTQRGRVERTLWLWTPWCIADVIPVLDPVQVLRIDWAADSVWAAVNGRPLPHGLGLIEVTPGPHRTDGGV